MKNSVFIFLGLIFYGAILFYVIIYPEWQQQQSLNQKIKVLKKQIAAPKPKIHRRVTWDNNQLLHHCLKLASRFNVSLTSTNIQTSNKILAITLSGSYGNLLGFLQQLTCKVPALTINAITLEQRSTLLLTLSLELRRDI